MLGSLCLFTVALTSTVAEDKSEVQTPQAERALKCVRIEQEHDIRLGYYFRYAVV